MYATLFTICSLLFWITTAVGICIGWQLGKYYTHKNAERKEQIWLEGYDDESGGI